MDNYIITKANNKDLNIVNNHIYIKNKKNDCIDYENSVCVKPWGHEFLIYKNKKIGIWFLKINNGHKTSLHCHFNKDTIIICLKGCAKIELINNKVINLNIMKPMFLPHYAFHSLGSYSDESYLIEIEIFNNNTTFSDKNDLLRIDDKYKRKDNIYETSIDLIRENIDLYNHFYINPNFSKNIEGVDINLTEINKENINSLNSEIGNGNNIHILLEGCIFQNFSYLREGSILNSFDNIQLLDDNILVLSLKKTDVLEDSKIIYNNEQLSIIVDNIKKNNKKIILSSGCFDIIHVGHINNLRCAKQMGDVLMVCLSSDEQIKILKGETRPINNYEDRINLFKTIIYVDYIILYNEENIENEETLGNIMKIVDPFLWVKGSDYSTEEIYKKHPYLKNIKLINNIPNKSTTSIINKISKNKVN